jgi:hypothetical protein
MSPMPNTAPRFTRVVTCHFLKYFRNPLSMPRGMMAGLSERYVATAPTEAAPGSPKRGFMSGESARLARLTIPNSEMRALKAPARMITPMRKRTVFRMRS